MMKCLCFLSVLLLLATLCIPAFADDLLIAAPVYPDMAPYPSPDDPLLSRDDAAYDAWRDSINAQRRDSAYTQGLAPFLERSIGAYLSGAGSVNRVYSPLSLYMALAMLAETTDGESRAEILALLGHEDLAALRAQASDLWNANYRADGASSRLLATSAWLNEGLSYNAETTSALAKHYYAAAYQGRMGSPEMDAALQKWLDENTMGLLTEQIQSVHLPESTALALASTVALKARWHSTFRPENNVTDVFHSPGGDVDCTFMRKTATDQLYWGESYQAVYLPFSMDGGMWLILPDEGLTPDDLLEDPAVLRFLADSSAVPESKRMRIHLQLPRFDVTSQMELSGGLKAMGVTKVFSANEADFSPLTDEALPIALSQVRHDARVVIDEEGCEAAAFTLMMMAMAAPPQQLEEIDFVLDRPFLFAVAGADQLPLFVGVVNRP